MESNLNKGESLESLGQYRVGVSFNPAGDDNVNKIKTYTTQLIDLLDGFNCKARFSFFSESSYC